MNALPAPKLLARAPRGGVVIGSKFYRGGQFIPRIRPTGGTALAFDLTREDLAVAITNPATGGTRHFRVETLVDGALAGRRVAMIRDDAARRWVSFGFVDAFGIAPWYRFRDDKRVAGPNGYIALLTESARFAARGVAYQITA